MMQRKMLLAFLSLMPCMADAKPMSVCDTAAQHAAEATGVPVQVLLAIARVESGRTEDGTFVPWPWTTNEAGKGSFFASKQDAIEHVERALASGAQNIDIGCFQVNLRWHGNAFDSLTSMFNPQTNARYAAEFLQRLWRETGSWEGAIGAYHSREALAAEGYLAKVRDHLTRLPAEAPLAAADHDIEPRVNTFPLLKGGTAGALGSLMAADVRGVAGPLLR